MQDNETTIIDLKEKIKKHGQLIMRHRKHDNWIDFYVCISSDKIPIHKGRKCYYSLVIGYDCTKQKINPLMNIFTFDTITKVKPNMWLSKFGRSDFTEVSKLELLVITGRTLEQHIGNSVIGRYSWHRCNKINNNNQYEISGVTEGNKTGICKHCGEEVIVNWYTIPKDGGKYDSDVLIYCKNGCWITDENTKRYYRESGLVSL